MNPIHSVCVYCASSTKIDPAYTDDARRLGTLLGGRGIRVDSAMYRGCVITPFYDSMIAKLIVWAPTRLEAIDKMEKALADFKIEGVTTNIPLQRKILMTEAFRCGQVNTNYLEEHLEEILNT